MIDVCDGVEVAGIHYWSRHRWKKKLIGSRDYDIKRVVWPDIEVIESGVDEAVVFIGPIFYDV